MTIPSSTPATTSGSRFQRSGNRTLSPFARDRPELFGKLPDPGFEIRRRQILRGTSRDDMSSPAGSSDRSR